MGIWINGALAKEATRITAAIEGMTANEAAVAGMVFGLGTGFIIALGVVLLAAGIVSIVLNFKQSMKLAKAFGKGTAFGAGLFLLGPVFRLVLGFGGAQYQGKPE